MKGVLDPLYTQFGSGDFAIVQRHPAQAGWNHLEAVEVPAGCDCLRAAHDREGLCSVVRRPLEALAQLAEG